MSTTGTTTTVPPGGGGGGGGGGSTTNPPITTTPPPSTTTTISTTEPTVTPPDPTSSEITSTSSTSTTSSTTSSSTTTSSTTSSPTSTTTSTSSSSPSTTAPPPTTTITSTATNPVPTTPATESSPAATSNAAGLASPNASGGSSADPKIIAVATVVPVVVVVLAILAGIWFWRKRRDRRNNEEMRRKEMEEYGFNPNNDPSLPPIGSVVDEEESAAGYRGWGTTSTARKASTNMSSQPAMARSDSGGRGINGQPSPPVGGPRYSDGHSGDPLVLQNTDAVAALGTAPAATGNKSAAMTRGPSNASSTYSAGNYSDVSALSDGPLPNDGPQDYGAFVHPDEGPNNGGSGWSGQPVIRDVSARRNTQIENSAVSPQQGTAGISQNF